MVCCMRAAPLLYTLMATICCNATAEEPFSCDLPDELITDYQPEQPTPMQAHLADVQAVLAVLTRIASAYDHYEGRGTQSCRLSEADIVERLKGATEELRPICARLRALPPDELRRLCLLADAIAWQADWVKDTYRSTHGKDLIYPEHLGLEIVAELSDIILRKLQRSSTSQEHVDALLELLSLFGGVDYLPVPRRLLDCRIAKDYKTAYNFFEEFTAACLLSDDEACIKRLNELAPVLDYLLQGGEADRLRIGALACAYRCAAYKSEKPRLIAEVVGGADDARKATFMKRHAALQPFFEKLPALKDFFYMFSCVRYAEKW